MSKNKKGTPLWKAFLFQARVPWRHDKKIKYFLWERMDGLRKNEIFASKIRRKKRLSILYVYAEKDRFPDSFNNLLKILRRIYGFKITIVCLDNFNEDKEDKTTRKNGYKIYDIGGDNSSWDFSGWKRGLEFLKNKKIRSDLILFINDSFVKGPKGIRNIKFYTSRINTELLYNLKENQAVGEINGAYEPRSKLMGHISSPFIRSSLFVLSKKVADNINFPLLDEKTFDMICPKKFKGKLFNKTNQLDSQLKRIFTKWVLHDWYKHCELKEENWNLIRSKIKGMLNERMLTIRLRENGVNIINIWEH